MLCNVLKIVVANIVLCDITLSGEGKENGEKTTIGLISQKAILHVQHTFLIHFFAIVLHKYNMKLPETSQLHVLGRKCYTHSCSLFFFTADHCHLGGHKHLSFSHRHYKISSNKKCLLCFYLSLQLSAALFLVELC